MIKYQTKWHSDLDKERMSNPNLFLLSCHLGVGYLKGAVYTWPLHVFETERRSKLLFGAQYKIKQRNRNYFFLI